MAPRRRRPFGAESRRPRKDSAAGQAMAVGSILDREVEHPRVLIWLFRRGSA